MAARLNVDPSKLLDTLKATVFRGANNDELLALVVIANEYELNPILREMFAFPGKKGGIVPLVSIDGWCRIINRQPHFDGVEFAFTTNEETGKPESCTCSIFVKDRSRPVTVTEYYSECYRNTDPWNQMPFRQLRHKALIQCGRYAFGFSGIHDEDEARDQAATNFQIPDTKTLTAVTVTTPEPEPTSEGEGDFAPETTAQQSQTPADKPKPSEPREPQLALANLIIEAGHKFDDFKKWGQEMFPNMPWDNINSFDEVPTQDAKRFQRAHVGLLRALAAVKGGAAL
jgi:phage recombination protein Bet